MPEHIGRVRDRHWLPVTGCGVGLHQVNGDQGYGRGHKPRQQHKPDREYEPHQPIIAGARQHRQLIWSALLSCSKAVAVQDQTNKANDLFKTAR
jgi:hypothetical protein